MDNAAIITGHLEEIRDGIEWVCLLLIVIIIFKK
jgi:hypothetical protein